MMGDGPDRDLVVHHVEEIDHAIEVAMRSVEHVGVVRMLELVASSVDTVGARAVSTRLVLHLAFAGELEGAARFSRELLENVGRAVEQREIDLPDPSDDPAIGEVLLLLCACYANPRQREHWLGR